MYIILYPMVGWGWVDPVTLGLIELSAYKSALYHAFYTLNLIAYDCSIMYILMHKNF
jgi:hypothetical protein